MLHMKGEPFSLGLPWFHLVLDGFLVSNAIWDFKLGTWNIVGGNQRGSREGEQPTESKDKCENQEMEGLTYAQ